jgi:hypothetical protein
MISHNDGVQAQAAGQAELKAVQAELQGATEMLDSMQQMASSSMEGQEEAQKQMDALTAQLQAAIQVIDVHSFIHSFIHSFMHSFIHSFIHRIQGLGANHDYWTSSLEVSIKV